MELSEAHSSGKEKKGLRRIWKKINNIFRKEPIATTSTPTAPTTTTTTSQSAPESKAVQVPDVTAPTAQQPSVSKNDPIEVDSMQEDTPLPTEAVAPPTQQPPREPSNEQEMQFWKAKAIFARYNVELTEADWGVRPKAPCERVSKPIRQRVRYTCHNCSTTFGYDKVCLECQHRRCTRCSRYPPRKDRHRNTKAPVVPQVAETAPEAHRESVEGACHECQTGFELGTQECPNCRHQICDRCIQETTITIDEPRRRADEQVAPGNQSTTVS
jgi:hypothetical protein